MEKALAMTHSIIDYWLKQKGRTVTQETNNSTRLSERSTLAIDRCGDLAFEQSVGCYPDQPAC